MVLKNIKEIKNIEKKIIHRKISSSRYVRMIRFFDVFFFIFTSHNFKVMHNQLSKIFSKTNVFHEFRRTTTKADFHRLYVEVF